MITRSSAQVSEYLLRKCPYEYSNLINVFSVSIKCCITFNITTTVVLPGNYFPYHLATDPSCSVKVNEGAAMKLLYKLYVGDERCLILWTCRSSRKGVHAWCNTPKVSAPMDTLVRARYAYLKLNPLPIIQQVSYKNGPCFSHHRWFNIYW